jgi:RNA polymerase sigma factor (TIGR02999 family)
VSDPSKSSVTSLLEEARAGRSSALDELFPLVYEELRARAQAQRRGWKGDETLNTTALIHETYLKLAGAEKPRWQTRAHFLAVGSRAMRQILVDNARLKATGKRGGERFRVSFDELRFDPGSGISSERAESLLALDRSLARLQEQNPRHGRIVECRFFGGMTIRDTAAALDVSPNTVKRGWAIAKAWLYRDMQGGPRASEA